MLIALIARFADVKKLIDGYKLVESEMTAETLEFVLPSRLFRQIIAEILFDIRENCALFEVFWNIFHNHVIINP